MTARAVIFIVHNKFTEYCLDTIYNIGVKYIQNKKGECICEAVYTADVIWRTGSSVNVPKPRRDARRKTDKMRILRKIRKADKALKIRDQIILTKAATTAPDTLKTIVGLNARATE